MNNSQKIKLFWKITRHINKKFCKNRLQINDIILFKEGNLHKSFPKNRGWYLLDEKHILIGKNLDFIIQLVILAHELSHAYQHQILGYKDRIRHDKKGGKMYQKFLKETNKILFKK